MKSRLHLNVIFLLKENNSKNHTLSIIFLVYIFKTFPSRFKIINNYLKKKQLKLIIGLNLLIHLVESFCFYPNKKMLNFAF